MSPAQARSHEQKGKLKVSYISLYKLRQIRHIYLSSFLLSELKEPGSWQDGAVKDIRRLKRISQSSFIDMYAVSLFMRNGARERGRRAAAGGGGGGRGQGRDGVVVVCGGRRRDKVPQFGD